MRCNMKMSKTILVSIFVAMLALLVWSQQTNRQGTRQGIPTTQVQTPKADPVAPVEYYGTFNIDLTLTLTTSVPSNGNVTCSSTVGLAAPDPNGTYTETATAVATHQTGGTWVCNMSIPYAWFLGTLPKYNMNFSAYINGPGMLGSTQGVVIRSTFWGSYYALANVPPPGTITNLSFVGRL
jgi:hypothetical protein